MDAGQDTRRIVERRVRFGTAELIAERDYPQRWAVVVDGVLQSYVDLADPTHLAMPFTVWFAEAIDHHWAAGVPLTAAHIGGAGASLARYLAATRPGSEQTVYELDDLLTELVREHLRLDAVPGLRVLVRDGGAALAEVDDASFDVVAQDAFQAGLPVRELATVEFARRARRVLRPDGLYLANLWGAEELAFVRGAVASADAVFAHVLVLAEAGVFMRARPGNVVLVASTGPLPHARLAEWAAGADEHVFCLNTEQFAAACGTAAPLTEAAELPTTAAVQRWGRGSRFGH